MSMDTSISKYGHAESAYWVVLGTQQRHRSHVTAEHIDGAEAAVKTVKLQKSDAASGSDVDLVKGWIVSEHEHLAVADIELLDNRILTSKVSRRVHVGEKRADVGNQLVVRVRLSRSHPTVRQGDHEDALLSHWTPKCRSWWERILGRNDEGITCASRLGELLLKPRAPDEADGATAPASSTHSRDNSSKSL